MKSPTQQQFEREASGLLKHTLWALGFFVLTVVAFRGFSFLVPEWFYGLIFGLWVSNVVEALVARGMLKRFYNVKRPPWRIKK